MSFLELSEETDFNWIEKWQKASTSCSIITNLEEIDNIYQEGWPSENLSLSESLALIAYLYQTKDMDIELPLALDSVIWTNKGLKLIPSSHKLKHHNVSDFANKISIEAISKWRTYSPLIGKLYRLLQSQGLNGLDSFISKHQLKQWKLLRPIIPSYIEELARQFIEDMDNNLVSFTGLEGEGERLVISAIIKELRKKGFIVITVPADSSYQKLVESLLQKITRLVPRNVIRSILAKYDGNIGRIISKYTNISYKGPSGILIPQMEGYWIGLTIDELLKLIDKPIAVIFENYIESARKEDLWKSLSFAKRGIFIKKDPQGQPIFPLMDPEEIKNILDILQLKDVDTLKLYALAEGKTSSVVSIIRALHYLNRLHDIPTSKDDFIKALQEHFGSKVLKYISAAFGPKKTEIPSELLLGINTHYDLLFIVESGLIDLYREIFTIGDNHLIQGFINTPEENIMLRRELIKSTPLSLNIVYHFLDELDLVSDNGKIILLKISIALLHKLRNTNLAEALELAWEIEKKFGELLLQYPLYYLLIGQVFMLNGRRERGYEIFSAVRMFNQTTPWILTHIMYYTFPFLTNGTGWQEIYEEIIQIPLENVSPCLQYLILDSITRYKLRENITLSHEEIDHLTKLFRQCHSFKEHTFRYRELMMNIHKINGNYIGALSEAIKLKETFDNTEPYLMAYGLFTTGMYLVLSGGNLWLATYYLERAFETFVYYYNVEAFLALGMAIQWKAQLLPKEKFEEYINGLLALIDMEGLILYDREYIYLSIALAYFLYGEKDIAKSFLNMASRDVIFKNGGDITRASMHLYSLLSNQINNLPFSEHYTYDMNNYVISSLLPEAPHLITADIVKSKGLREVDNEIEHLTKLSKNLYRNGFKLLAAYIHAIIGKNSINLAREIANFHFRRAKHLFDILESKWANVILEEIELSDPFYALAIKIAKEVEHGNIMNTSDATELIEMFIETIRIMQNENDLLEQIITLIESFSSSDNPITAGTDFIKSALTIWGASRGWLYLEANGIPKLWIHTNIQGTDEEDFLMLPMAVNKNILSPTGNFTGVVIGDNNLTLKIYIESDEKNKFGRNHMFVLSRSGDALLHFLVRHI